MLGDLGAAWRYNPIAIPVVVMPIGAAVWQGLGLATGRWLNVTRRRELGPSALAGLAVRCARPTGQ
jgi:hypothetical protein